MDVSTAIGRFLGEADSGERYGRDEMRELRAALAHVDSELGTLPLDEVGPDDVRRLVDQLRHAGLSPARTRSVVAALRSLYAYAIEGGLVRSSPVVGLAAEQEETPRTPTEAVLALGEYAVSLVVRTIVIAFVLVAAGLVLALL